MKHRSGAEKVMCRKNLGLVPSYGFFQFCLRHHQGDITSTILRQQRLDVAFSSSGFYLGKASKAINLHSNLLSQDN
jgi:hypothetical protein